MATEYKRLDNNGLLYLLTLLKTEIDNAGEDNVIETVKVNGTALTPVNKAVDVEVPTKTSDLTNDGDGTSNFATEDYVDENGGKIDVIKVNGTAQTITNKEVDINSLELVAKVNSGGAFCGVENPITHDILNVAVLPNGRTPDTLGVSFVHEDIKGTYSEVSALAYTTTKTDKLLAEKTDETQVQEMIDEALADITGIDFQIVSTLPATGVKGVIYLVGTESPYDEYIWLEPTGATPYFEQIGSTDIDLSGYVQASEMHALTNAEIDTIFQQVFGS